MGVSLIVPIAVRKMPLDDDAFKSFLAPFPRQMTCGNCKLPSVFRSKLISYSRPSRTISVPQTGPSKH